MSVRRVVAAVAGAVVGGISMGVVGAPSAAAATVALPCLIAFDDIVNQNVSLDPGETLQFSHAGACAGGYYLGIRDYGAQSATSPTTAGVVESSLGGVNWTVVTTEAQDNNATFVVRYTAPATPGASDSFYVISAAYGAGRAGYLYTVSVNRPAAGAGPDGTVWQLATARASADAPCPDGYGSSWASWPHAGSGGWVCVRHVWAYGPDGRPGPP